MACFQGGVARLPFIFAAGVLVGILTNGPWRSESLPPPVVVAPSDAPGPPRSEPLPRPAVAAPPDAPNRPRQEACHAPFFVAKPLLALQDDHKWKGGAWKEYWSGNPGVVWADATEPLISMADLADCQRAFDWKDVKEMPGGVRQDTFSNPNLVGLSPRCYQYWRYQPSWYQYTSMYSAATGNFGLDAYASSVMMNGGDKLFLDFLLMSEPRKTMFAEFGTAGGLTSIYVGIAMAMRGGRLYTFDILDTRKPEAKVVWNDTWMVRMYEDILEAAGPCRAFSCTATNLKVADVIRQSDFWLVDNGIKDKEVFLYAKYLKIGGLAFVHDMYSDPEQYDLFDQPFRYYGYEAVYLDFAVAMGSHLRAWRRVRERASQEEMMTLNEPRQTHPARGGYA